MRIEMKKERQCKFTFGDHELLILLLFEGGGIEFESRDHCLKEKICGSRNAPQNKAESILISTFGFFF
jgi:hypothetical protein